MVARHGVFVSSIMVLADVVQDRCTSARQAPPQMASSPGKLGEVIEMKVERRCIRVEPGVEQVVLKNAMIVPARDPKSRRCRSLFRWCRFRPADRLQLPFRA